MIDYTPTTEEVREAYGSIRLPSGDVVEVKSWHTDSEFNRWLAQHDTETVKATEERIITLLEADCDQGIGDNLDGCFHEVTIALIKGDNK